MDVTNTQDVDIAHTELTKWIQDVKNDRASLTAGSWQEFLPKIDNQPDREELSEILENVERSKASTESIVRL